MDFRTLVYGEFNIQRKLDLNLAKTETLYKIINGDELDKTEIEMIFVEDEIVEATDEKNNSETKEMRNKKASRNSEIFCQGRSNLYFIEDN